MNAKLEVPPEMAAAFSACSDNTRTELLMSIAQDLVSPKGDPFQTTIVIGTYACSAHGRPEFHTATACIGGTPVPGADLTTLAARLREVADEIEANGVRMRTFEVSKPVKRLRRTR